MPDPGFDRRSGDEGWRKALLEGAVAVTLARRLFRIIPRSPRCHICLSPFAGVGGRALSLVGRVPSRKNPNWCTACFENAPLGGAEVDLGILFADIRGFTSMAEPERPEDMARLLNRFYAVATEVLARNDAVIDKLAGDEVMALFVPGLAGPDFLKKLVLSAEGLLRATGYGTREGPWLDIGVGLNYGEAFVGNLGSDNVVKDFTAVGDAVNVASRLTGEAKPGEIVMAERVYREVADRYPDVPAVALDLKGKSAPVTARVVSSA